MDRSNRQREMQRMAGDRSPQRSEDYIPRDGVSPSDYRPYGGGAGTGYGWGYPGYDEQSEAWGYPGGSQEYPREGASWRYPGDDQEFVRQRYLDWGEAIRDRGPETMVGSFEQMEKGYVEAHQRYGEDCSGWDPNGGGPAESLTRRGMYRGRGPLGYQRSEESVVDEMYERLAENAEVDLAELEISFRDGVVTVRGMVSGREQREIVEQELASISGAGDIVNEIRVAGPSTDKS